METSTPISLHNINIVVNCLPHLPLLKLPQLKRFCRDLLSLWLHIKYALFHFNLNLNARKTSLIQMSGKQLQELMRKRLDCPWGLIHLKIYLRRVLMLSCLLGGITRILINNITLSKRQPVIFNAMLSKTCLTNS